jgi:hypothetical protein
MTRNGQQASAWADVRIYYFADLDRLLADFAVPLFAELAGHGARAYYQRHWVGGPHVRLSVSARRDQLDSHLVPLATARAADYLSVHPSRAAGPSDADVHGWYAALSRLEAITEADTGRASDNSVVPCQHADRLHVLGSEAAVTLFEDFHVASSQAALAGITDNDARANRLAIAVGLMIAMARDFPGGARRGALSFRSHAEGAIMGAPDPPGLRKFLDGMSARAQPALAAFREPLGERHGAVPGAGHLAGVPEIYGTLIRATTAVQTLVRNDLVMLPLSDPLGRRQWDPQMLRHSPFHQRLQTNPRYLELMATDLELKTHRVLVNLLYLHLAKLGLRPIHRVLAARLAADTVDSAAEDDTELPARRD